MTVEQPHGYEELPEPGEIAVAALACLGMLTVARWCWRLVRRCW